MNGDDASEGLLREQHEAMMNNHEEMKSRHAKIKSDLKRMKSELVLQESKQQDVVRKNEKKWGKKRLKISKRRPIELDEEERIGLSNLKSAPTEAWMDFENVNFPKNYDLDDKKKCYEIIAEKIQREGCTGTLTLNTVVAMQCYQFSKILPQRQRQVLISLGTGTKTSLNILWTTKLKIEMFWFCLIFIVVKLESEFEMFQFVLFSLQYGKTDSTVCVLFSLQYGKLDSTIKKKKSNAQQMRDNENFFSQKKINTLVNLEKKDQ